MNPPRPITLDAPAKLNLSLLVGDRQPGGLHRIESIFCPISLMDEVTCSFRNSEDPGQNSFHAELQFSDQVREHLAACGFDSGLLGHSLTSLDNIALRAGIRYFERFFPQGGHHLELRLVKRIPLEAGLGGGSADAAAVLRACREHFGLPNDPEELFNLAAEIGSDVSAALAGGMVLVEGTGERLRRLKPGRLESGEEVSTVQQLAELGLVILKPPAGVPTALAYRALARPEASPQQQPPSGIQTPTASLLQQLRLGLDLTEIGRKNELTSQQAEGISGVPKKSRNPESVVSGFVNDFEVVVRAAFPQVEEAFAMFEHERLRDSGLLRAVLAGSGSSVVGFCRSKVEAEQVLAIIQRRVAPGWFAVTAEFLV